MTKLLMPALQGNLGSWVYYSALMRLSDVAERVHYAHEIHKNDKLGEMIQRRLDDRTRSDDIAQYLLKTKDRFFNSLVVGVYHGSPKWHPFDVQARNKSQSLRDMTDTERDVIGYLELDGEERLFALDGQHRLAGIMQAVKKDKALGLERVSVIFVPHSETAAGLRKTRSLFVAINKKAVPVAKRDIIALDEIDLAAIITRQLIDEHPLFNRGQVDLNRFTPSIPATASALTTIGHFYDVVKIVIGEIVGDKKGKELVQASRTRLPDKRIAEYAKAVGDYLEAIIDLDPELKAALTAKNLGDLIPAGRTRGAVRVLFRPIGLTIFTKVVAQLRKKHDLAKSLKLARKIPLLMTAAPFDDVIWDATRNKMMTSNSLLCVGLLLHMLGEVPADKRLRERYAAHRGRPAAGIRLPSPFPK